MKYRYVIAKNHKEAINKTFWWTNKKTCRWNLKIYQNNYPYQDYKMYKLKITAIEVK